ncbi:scarecrow-like protein 14 [Lotus japonicus]|uniref:scarecrow-like protein 14 n=1 Tax=Lotus japonicus TaxID=34305 RepID=UPI00258B43E3|nr:scarecrow-like protein 14 [Lotus japonicus]
MDDDRVVDPSHCAGKNSAYRDEGSCLGENESESDQFSSTILSYINQTLMEEEDMEEKYSMFQDSLALKHAEKSLYEAIGQKYPSSPPPPPPPPPPPTLDNYTTLESPDQSFSSNFSDYSFSSDTSSGTTSGFEFESIECNSFTIPTTLPIPSTTHYSTNHTSYFTTNNTGLGLDSALLSKSYLVQFERGVEQGTMFLPVQTPFITYHDNTTLFPSFTNPAPHGVIKSESHEEEHFLGRRHRKQEDEDEDEAEEQHRRSTKRSEAYIDDTELSELFDKLLVQGTRLGNNSSPYMRQGKTEEVVNLRTLLMQCAQAISSDDISTAKSLLKQIKQHSSPMGNGTQRLAHYFGNALEARLAGTGSQIYRMLSSKRTSAADMIRAYQVYSLACPFEKLAIMFANNSIWNKAKDVETLHIVDFGIGYGFKWPAFIHRISKRPGGSPKLRITGIELLQPGFRPLQRVHETGKRLASYCNRFNVPFEFNAIAQRWETIKVEDLKIKKNEFLAVNCLFRSEKLLDETVVEENPRGAVLDLIKKANPGIFVHGIVNGCYNAPFFSTRFREAVFHYTALFDVLDTNLAREDPMRLMFEEEFCGKEVMNVVACEGCERIERPETYKQWQLRIMRSGFRHLPLDDQIINKLRGRLRDDKYNSDIILQVDGNWVLQGWKGRILYASSCWVPA